MEVSQVYTDVPTVASSSLRAKVVQFPNIQDGRDLPVHPVTLIDTEWKDYDGNWLEKNFHRREIF